jgi:hypothetical protein
MPFHHLSQSPISGGAYELIILAKDTEAPLQGPYIFISYPRLEEVFAKRLEQDLRVRGLQYSYGLC